MRESATKRGVALWQGGGLACRESARPGVVRILIASVLGVVILAGVSYGLEGQAHNDGHAEVTEGEHHDDGHGNDDASDDAHGANDDAHDDAHDDAQPAAQAEIIQTECPVMVGNEIDPNFSTVYQGRRIYFCCQFCRAAFEQEPEKYLANLPQGGEAASVEGGPHAGSDHDHATGHRAPQGLARSVRFVGKFHPVAVHFPIALVIAAAVAEVLAAATGSHVFRGAARFMIVLGALCAAVTAALGWAAGAFANYPAGYAQTFSLHRWAGTLTGVLVIISAVLCELSYRRGSRIAGVGYRVTLALAVVLVSVTGYLGGILVYGPGHYAW